jgi:hypothetical protein
MFIVFEISRPFQRRLSFYRSKGYTTWSICWLFFRLSHHPMRFDEMIELASCGRVKWDSRKKAG